MRRLFRGLFVVVSLSSLAIQASDDVINLGNSCSRIVMDEYDYCRDRMKILGNCIDELKVNVTSLPEVVHYKSLQNACVLEKLFESYEKECLDMISSFAKNSKKVFGAPSQYEITNKKNSFLVQLQKNKAAVKEWQKERLYCDECKNCKFDVYDKDNCLQDGYRDLEGIPQMGLFVQNKTDAQLSGQLNKIQKHYVNLLHWMHHKLENSGLNTYVKGLKPISFDYNNASITVKDWDLMHVFMGDIKGNHLGGVHVEDNDLFTSFYERKQDRVLIQEKEGKKNNFNKLSTFFPDAWDMKTCVNKACEALCNIDKIEAGDQHGLGNIVVHGHAAGGEKIAVVVDPVKNLAVSFYPEK